MQGMGVLEAALGPNVPSSAVSGPNDAMKDGDNDDSPRQTRETSAPSSQVVPHPGQCQQVRSCPGLQHGCMDQQETPQLPHLSLLPSGSASRDGDRIAARCGPAQLCPAHECETVPVCHTTTRFSPHRNPDIKIKRCS